MMKKALLVIGDEKIARKRPHISFRRFIGHARRLKNKEPFELKIINYTQLLSKAAPAISASLIKVIFFFPYQYWNRNIETYQNGKIYGDKTFGGQFRVFFKEVKKTIEAHYAGKKIEYLIHPRLCCLDRDKQASKNALTKGAISTPRTFSVSSFRGVQRLLSQGLDLYIKPRFGAMGKGITYLNKEEAVSNFLFRRGEVISRLSDFNWKFSRIKDRQTFIKQLLKKGFICEEAIRPAIFKGRRFDFRVYVLFGKVIYFYAKSSEAGSCVTNWSQGGRIDKRETILRKFPKQKIAVLKNLARKAARTLGLNFAGVDIIFSENLKNAYVLEGNAFPGHEKSFDLMKSLAEKICR